MEGVVPGAARLNQFRCEYYVCSHHLNLVIKKSKNVRAKKRDISVDCEEKQSQHRYRYIIKHM